MMSRPRMIFAALLSGGVLLLTGCTSSPTPQPTVTSAPVITEPSVPNVTTTPSTDPSAIGNPAKYALTSQEFPGTVSLLLKNGTKLVEQKSSLTGSTYNANCGVVFLAQQFVKTDTLLTPEQQQTQSLALITDYEKRAGKATNIGGGVLNTNEQIPGSGDNYTVETEQATFDNKQYAGVLHTRVFANGTGVAVAFLCRAGTAVPDVNSNVVLNIG